MQISAQVVPYNTSPDWISNPNQHRATGLGIADINGDGWKDLVVANGNDMARQNLVVYYNQGDGTFPPDPGWSSADIDYHGHLACGDLDFDGDIDVVVSVYIGEAGFSEPGRIKIYYNEGTRLEDTPSFISEPFYTFSCALGDADGDGDLDIAATAGEPYGSILDHGRIFYNHEGAFQTEAEWKSSVLMGALDVEFGDINQDGFLDVIFVCEGTPNLLYLAGTDGVIDIDPDWQSEELQNYINSVDIGYELGHTVVAMTENSQLGGTGRVRRYEFSENIPASGAASWYSEPFGYGSGILLNDFDQGGLLDLIYGGWWLPVKIAFGTEGGFETEPSYTSSTNSVVEAVLLGDLGREDEWYAGESFLIEASRAGTNVLILSPDMIDRVVNIYKNGVSLSAAEYCHLHGKSWIAFRAPLQADDLIEIGCIFSPYPDMVITNWDSNKGNYIFYNTEGGLGYEENTSSVRNYMIFPNPASDDFQIKLPPLKSYTHITITDLQGRIMKTQEVHRAHESVTLNSKTWPAGIYYVVILQDGESWSGKLIIK